MGALTQTRRRPAVVPLPQAAVSLERPESERAALAAMLLGLDAAPAATGTVADLLMPAMFTDPVHAGVMYAIKAALQSDKPGIATVAAALRRHAQAAGTDYAEATGVVADLFEMFVGSDPITAAKLAAEEVLEVYRRRSAIDAIDDARLALVQGAGLAEVEAVAKRLEAILQPSHGPATSTGLVDLLDDWAKRDAEPVIRTLFAPVDDRMGGGLPVGITGIAARPSQGKSALALQLTLGALLADSNATAIWFRGEMTNAQLACRMAAVWSAIRGEPLQPVTRKDGKRRTKAARQAAIDLAEIVGNRFAIVEPPLCPATFEREITARKPTLAVIDYLQRCQAPGMADRRTEIEHVVRELSRLSAAHNVATIVVSSMAGGRQVGTGIGALAKESNQLDYDAHAFLTLWGEDSQKELDPREVQLRIEKSRDGGEGAVTLHFSGSGQFFSVDPKSEAPAFEEFSRYAPGGVL